MSTVIEMPPSLYGQDGQALYRYLYRMAEQLNVALEQINGDVGGGTELLHGRETTLSQQNARDELQALIVNTAQIIRSEMDRLETVLRSDYAAVSNRWGLYKEQMHNTITATAEGIVQQYGFEADIESLEAQALDFERYRISTEGFIRQGFVERNEAGVPIIGIAIGQGLTGVETTVDGQTVLELDASQSCAFYTAERVSFRIGGREVAYLSNRRLYVEDVEVTGGLRLGRWLLEGSDGLMIKFIG